MKFVRVGLGQLIDRQYTTEFLLCTLVIGTGSIIQIRLEFYLNKTIFSTRIVHEPAHYGTQ